MKVLVTGGAGYVGGFSARYLLGRGHEVATVDNLSQGHRAAFAHDCFYEGEISDSDGIRKIIADHDIELVMHFAASAFVGVSVTDPRHYYRNNVANTLSLLEAVLDAGVKRVVFSSTCSIYGEEVGETLDETQPPNPMNPYAFTKYCIERMIEDFSNAYGLSYVLLRYFNAAGAAPDGQYGEDHDPETHLIPLALQAVSGQRGKLSVFGDDYDTPDGTCLRDYIHVEDLASIHELAANWCMDAAPGEGEVFNVGTGQGNSVMEVLRAAEAVAGRPVPYQMAARRPGDPPRLVANAEKAGRVLGWKPNYTDIQDVVETAWQWHSKHPRGYTDST